MSVTTIQQKQKPHDNELLAKRQKSGTRSVCILTFTSGSSHYAVEMSELKKVIRDLLSIEDCTSRPVTTGFIKRNRGQTIVFNLESCFSIQQCTSKKEGKTSILILNETISGSRVGVLVPGTMEIQKMHCPRTGCGLDTSNEDALPVRGIIRNKKPGTGNTDDGITLIDIRTLVGNCIARLRYCDTERIAAQTA